MEKLKIDVSISRPLEKNRINLKLPGKTHLKPISFKLGKNVGSINTIENEDDFSDVKEVLSLLNKEISSSPLLESSTQCTELRSLVSHCSLENASFKKPDLLLTPKIRVKKLKTKNYKKSS